MDKVRKPNISVWESCMYIGKCNAVNNGNKPTGIRESLGLRILRNTKNKITLNFKAEILWNKLRQECLSYAAWCVLESQLLSVVSYKSWQKNKIHQVVLLSFSSVPLFCLPSCFAFIFNNISLSVIYILLYFLWKKESGKKLTYN
jgi:hypothetical protein